MHGYMTRRTAITRKEMELDIPTHKGEVMRHNHGMLWDARAA
jgi:hypothetical protein